MREHSEVARLLESIRQSYESAYAALHGPAIVGKHEFIANKMKNMHQVHEQLKTIVGEQEAMKLVAQTLEAIQEGSKAEIELP